MSKIFDFVKPGVITGDDVQKVFEIAKANQFALPAVNCVGTDSINAVLEAAAKAKSPVVVQFSNGGAAFIAGKGLPHHRAAQSDELFAQHWAKGILDAPVKNFAACCDHANPGAAQRQNFNDRPIDERF